MSGATWFAGHAKRIADGLTGARAGIALVLVWLGWVYGAAGLGLAVWLLLINWTGDSVDGVIARCNRPQYHTWLGDHDLEIDMLVAAGLLSYMVSASFVTPALGGLYVVVCAVVLWRLNRPRALGMLCQAPVYGWFMIVALLNLPTVGIWLPVWIGVAMIITWPRFLQEIVPNFTAGIRKLLR